MKKVYCFHCQRDIQPYRIWKWQICPHCFRLTEDTGEGFYLVCDKCGANMPVNSDVCPQCGYCRNGGENLSQMFYLPRRKGFWQYLADAGMVVLSLFLFLALLYVSFYIVAGAFFAGLLFYLFQKISDRRF